MPMSAQQLTTLARQAAKARGFVTQSGQLLNGVLSELCLEYDFDRAKQVFNFTLTPATAQIGNLNAQLASGPFILPVDYLRAKRNNVLFFPNGLANFPLRLIPIDIDEFDGLIQQAGFQNFPSFWVTDMSQAAGSLQVGMAATLQGAVTNASTTLTLAAAPSTGQIVTGMGVSGLGIVPGTRITYSGSGTSVTLSQAAVATIAAASYNFGTCPIAYVWPPASGSYPAMVRYQSLMPDILTPESSQVIPWYPGQQWLIDKLTARLMRLTGDDRWRAMDGACDADLRKLLELKDDDENRAKRVTLDRRRFGRQWSTLPASKILGY